jgi:hypothetical protein
VLLGSGPLARWWLVIPLRLNVVLPVGSGNPLLRWLLFVHPNT